MLRRPFTWIVCAAIGLGLIWIVPRMIGLYLLGSALAESRAVWSHERLGHQLKEDGQFSRAAIELQAALDAGSTDPQTVLALGECLEKLGRPAEALPLYEKAIGDGRWWPPYIAKAQFLEKRDGTTAAVAFLEGVESKPAGEKIPSLLAWFHNEAGRSKEAIFQYERVLQMVTDRDGITFDPQGRLVLDPAFRTKNADGYYGLGSAPKEVADLYWKDGQLDAALKAATTGLSISQEIERHKSDYLSKDMIEAGDTLCRIVRARVFLSRRDLDAARREISFAKIGGDRRYPPYVAEISELEARLQSLSADSR